VDIIVAFKSLISLIDHAYDFKFLDFMSSIALRELEPFWRDVLISDDRNSARKRAQAGLASVLSNDAVQAIISECDELKVIKKNEIKLQQEAFKNKAKDFIPRLHKLFIGLRQQKIFAVDIKGSGWAPSDNGLDVVYEMISSKDLIEFGVTSESDMSVCWTDTGFFKRDEGRIDKNQYCVYVYFDAPSKAEKFLMTSRISESTISKGFQVDWKGNSDKAIMLS
jgi:hypothetical protein